MGGDEVGQGVGIEQGHVAGGDDDGALEVGRQCGQPAADRMSGSELPILDRDIDRAAQRLG